MKRIVLRTLLIVIVISRSFSIVAENDSIEQKKELNAYEAFLNLPDDLLPIIDKSARFEMLEYYLVDSIYNSTNQLNGQSHIDTLSNDYIHIAISKASDLSLKILSGKKNEKIIAAIYTYYGPAADSKLYFLDESFNKIETKKYFKAPKIKEFFYIPKGSITKMEELEEMISFPTIKYTFIPGSNDIKLELTVGEHINQDDYNIMRLFLLPGLTYEWQNGKYKKQKNNK